MSSAKSKTANKIKKGTKKEDLNLCQSRGCRKPRIDESHFCEYHATEFFYIDLAYKVNVTGVHKPVHNVFSQARIDKKNIINNYYKKEIETEMNSTLLDKEKWGQLKCIRMCSKKGYIVKCDAAVKHSSEYALCPRHLKLSLLDFMRKREQFVARYSRKYNEDDENYFPFPMPKRYENYSLPEEIKEQCKEVSKSSAQIWMEGCLCRHKHWNSNDTCDHLVDGWHGIGYCSKHIHSIQAILCILKRNKVLQSGILIKNLREMVCSYV
jgi:hypothetical protein